MACHFRQILQLRANVTTPSNDLCTQKWSKSKRMIASALIAIYLGIVVLGPLTNPVSSENFSAPLGRLVAPIHQSLYLGHGYRFFGPDPGASHLVYYEVDVANGETLDGHFPDRDSDWPRLLYHRWFMLSETLYDEHAFTPDQQSFELEQQELQAEVDKMMAAGEFDLVEFLEAEQLERKRRYKLARTRIAGMVDALESHLLNLHGGQEVRLYLRERALPEPMDLKLKVELDDPRYLSPLMPIGATAEKNPPELMPLEGATNDAPANSTTEGKQ